MADDEMITDETLYRRMQQRGALTRAEVLAANEVPLERELVVAVDTGDVWLGDGKTPVSGLPGIRDGLQGEPGEPGEPGTPGVEWNADTRTYRSISGEGDPIPSIDPVTYQFQGGVREGIRSAEQPFFAPRELAYIAVSSALRDQLPPLPLDGVASTGVAYTNLVGLLASGQKVITNTGFSAGQIGVTQDGATAIWGKNFEGGNGIVEGVTETLDGELLVAVMHRDNTPGVVYRSTGWNPQAADATTWNIVLTASGPSVHFDGRWCLHQRSIAPSWSARPHAVFIAEYGNHFSEATSDDKAAIHVYMSEDDGTTFRPVFDLRDHRVDSNAHVHAVAYDPYDDRLIVSVGDNANAAVFYCNGEDLAAPSWVAIASTAGSSSTQVTTVIPMPNGLICLSDSPTSAIRRIPRQAWRRYGVIETILSLSTGNPAMIGAHAYQREWSGPLLMSFYGSAGTAAPSIYATRDGKTVVPIYTSAATTSGPGLIQVVGPDEGGKVWATRNLNGSGVLIAGAYSEPIPSASSGGSGSTAPAAISEAAKYGLVAQTYAAHLASSTSAALTSGTVYVMKVTAEALATAAARNVRLFQSNAASGLTLAKIAVYSAAGVQLGTSADISSMLMTAGPVTRTISVGSFGLVKGMDYYVALLVVGSTGPVLGRTSNSGVANAGLTAAALLWSTAGSAATDMPVSIDPSALSSQNTAFWFGLL